MTLRENKKQRIERIVNKIEELWRELDPYDSPPIEETISETRKRVIEDPLEILEQIVDSALELL